MNEIRQFTKRLKQLVTVVSIDSGDKDWPGDSLLGMIEWLHEKADLVPVEYRPEARFEIEVLDDDNGYWPHISISYYRLETDEEMDVRAIQERDRFLATERRELTLLTQLQEKYKNKTL